MRVAFGKVVITPKQIAEGIPMAGYTRPFLARNKLDDIYAHGILIEEILDSGIYQRYLFLSLDFLKIPLSISTYIKNKIMTQVKLTIDAKNIMIHATHTHSAPDLTGEFYWPGGFLNVFRGIMFGVNRSDRYIVYFVHRIVKMVEEMIIRLEPAKIAVTKQSIKEDILINRRNPARRSKKDLWVFVFKRITTNEIFGILGHYPMHPTSLSYRNDRLSADYPGRFCAKIEADSLNRINAIFFTGAAGDLNPITTCGTDFETLENNPQARKTVYDQLGTYLHTKKIGYFLAEKALNLANSIPDDQYFDSLIIIGNVKSISIQIRDYQPYVYKWGTWFGNKLIFYLKCFFLFPIAIRYNPKETPNFPALTLKMTRGSFLVSTRMKIDTIIQYFILKLSNQDNPSKIELIHIFGIPGEVFEDLGEKLINSIPQNRANSIIFQNTNDWIAYLFEIKDYISQVGEESIVSATPISGTVILKEFRKFFQSIQNS